MMSACFCSSLIRPSPPIHESYLPWLSVRPNFPLIQRKYPNFSSTIFARVLQQGLGVVSPDDVSLNSPVVDDTKEEGKEDVRGALDGVADAKSEEKALSSSNRAKKKTEDDEGSDRFKLRNGREVRFLFYRFIFWDCWLARNILGNEQ